jgi:hypothetical protein
MRTGLRQPCAAQRPTVDSWFLGTVFALLGADAVQMRTFPVFVVFG